MRLLILALLVASVTCVSVRQAKVGNSVYDDEWETYKIKYEKKYETLAEEMKRRLIWEDNMALINKHNLEAARGEHSFTMGQGPFSDLTNEEFRAQTTCIDGANMPKLATTPQTYNVRAPDSIDWRQKGVVSSVKDQKQCGSCWAFATAATIESRQAIDQNQGPYDLSPQQIVDCDTNNYGCGGGWPYISMTKYVSGSGVQTWNSYPYAGVQQTCTYSASQVVAHISNVGIIQGDENQMKEEIGNNGPIAILLNAGSPSFQQYTSGVYDDASCSTSPNHAVTAVGYGNEDGKDYWLVKNSWGDTWGAQGYFKIARGVNRCGVNSQCAYCNGSN